MNRPPLAKRTQILTMLCEGSSMRSISRFADAPINTVSKPFVEVGKPVSLPRKDGAQLEGKAVFNPIPCFPISQCNLSNLGRKSINSAG
jgi:hypothetical protein